MTAFGSRTNCFQFSAEELESTRASGKLLTMEIEFSKQCNLNCKYCYAEKERFPAEELTVPEIKDVLQQSKELGMKRVIVLGGEPMVYPHTMELIRHMSAQGLGVEIFTNGFGMTPEIAQELFVLKVRVVLKMNSFEEKTQDMLCGRLGAYRTIRHALQNLKQAGFGARDSFLAISSIICKQNLGELPRMWAWIREQGFVPYFEIITPQGKAVDNDSLFVHPTELRKLFFKISEIDRTVFGIQWDPQPPLAGGSCMRHQFSCVVNSVGEVFSCVGVNIPLGNIRRTALKTILSESEVIANLKNFKNTIKGPCHTCKKYQTCYGCRGAAYQMTGDYLESDPLCWNNIDRQNEIRILPLDVGCYMPHCAPMRLIDKLLSMGEHTSDFSAEIRPEMIFVNEDGTLDECAFPEMVAQSIAARRGYDQYAEKCPKKGYLLGVKKFVITGKARVGDTITVTIEKVGEYGDFGIVCGTVRGARGLLARGEIKIWQDTLGQMAAEKDTIAPARLEYSKALRSHI